jgi:GTP-binding protein HflX
VSATACENVFAQVVGPTYPCRYMTNAPDFNLRDALDATRGWDDDTIQLDDELLETEPDADLDDDFESGYADDEDYDETDPEELTVGAQELAERHALRRVASLRTELEDITEVEYRQLRLEKVVLVGVWTEGSVTDAENSMAELALLAETAGSEVLEAVFQRRQKPDPATYIGRGKVEAIREIVQATGADTVICDGELAPSQLRNLEDKIKVKVVDRQEQGGPGAGRAGPAAVHEAAPPRLGRQPLPPGRWPCRRR